MLRDEIALYTELSGNNGEHTPIGIIGAYLDGYDKGREERPQGEWLDIYSSHIAYECSCCGLQTPIADYYHYCTNCGAKMRVEHKLNELEEADNETN